MSEHDIPFAALPDDLQRAVSGQPQLPLPDRAAEEAAEAGHAEFARAEALFFESHQVTSTDPPTPAYRPAESFHGADEPSDEREARLNDPLFQVLFGQGTSTAPSATSLRKSAKPKLTYKLRKDSDGATWSEGFSADGELISAVVISYEGENE